MAKILLDVPVRAQEKDYCCWHTAAYMIWLYWQGQTKRQGPMFTVSEAYDAADTTGLSVPKFITLAKHVGLNEIETKNQHSDADLHGYLTSMGPLWCAGSWFGPGHVIVLTGIDGSEIHFNDPDQGKKKKATTDWFNKKLWLQTKGSLMVKNAKAY